jgi:hypothetical protein
MMISSPYDRRDETRRDETRRDETRDLDAKREKRRRKYAVVGGYLMEIPQALSPHLGSTTY